MAYNYYPYQTPYYPTQNNAFQGVGNVGTNTNALIWVQGEGAAKSYPVAPNTSVPLWDSEANVIYIKSADASGMPSIKVLDYTIRDNASKSAEIQPQTDFATKDEVTRLAGEISALKAKFEKIGRKEKSDGK